MEDGIEQYMSTFLQNYKENPCNRKLGEVPRNKNENNDFEPNESIKEYQPYYCKSKLFFSNQISKETKKKIKQLWSQISKNMEDLQ
jgi:hypothetical protein